MYWESASYIHPGNGDSRMTRPLWSSLHQRSEGSSHLNLFHSLDEFSSFVEPIFPASYECLPTGYDESKPKIASCPRAFADIWSHDSQSTSDSRTHEGSSDCKLSQRPIRGFTDYSHFIESDELGGARQGEVDRLLPFDVQRPGVSWREIRPSVVLNLSNLIG